MNHKLEINLLLLLEGGKYKNHHITCLHYVTHPEALKGKRYEGLFSHIIDMKSLQNNKKILLKKRKIFLIYSKIPYFRRYFTPDLPSLRFRKNHEKKPYL